MVECDSVKHQLYEGKIERKLHFTSLNETHLKRFSKGTEFSCDKKKVRPTRITLYSVFTHVINEHVFQPKQKKTLA